MLTVTCIQKFRNKQNQIYGYRLQDQQGNIKDVYSDQLKAAIRNNKIDIVNLTLTSDNRLVAKTPEKQHKLNNKMTNEDQEEQRFKNILAKANLMGISKDALISCKFAYDIIKETYNLLDKKDQSLLVEKDTTCKDDDPTLIDTEENNINKIEEFNNKLKEQLIRYFANTKFYMIYVTIVEDNKCRYSETYLEIDALSKSITLVNKDIIEYTADSTCPEIEVYNNTCDEGKEVDYKYDDEGNPIKIEVRLEARADDLTIDISNIKEGAQKIKYIADLSIQELSGSWAYDKTKLNDNHQLLEHAKIHGVYLVERD